MEHDLHKFAKATSGRRLSRRSFLGRTMMLSASLGVGTTLLQACGDPDETDETTDDPGVDAGDSEDSEEEDPDDAADDDEDDEDAEADDESTPDDSEAGFGGTLTHGSAQEPDRFWGPITGLTVSREIALLVNASLLKINEELELVPELVEEVPTLENGGISEDGLVITFNLLPDVRWHDGETFTSTDVRFTYEVIMMDGVDVRGRVGWDQVSSVETPDDQTVIFNFESVDAPFLNRVSTVSILPEHILGGLEPQEINEHEWFNAPVGLGPFTFVEWEEGSHIIVDRNPDYFKPDLPKLDRVIYRIIPDNNTLINQLETGDIDTRVRSSNQDIAVVDEFSDVDVNSVPSVTPWLLWVNHTRAPFDDVLVRQALAHGFDKVGLAEELLNGLVEPAWGLISPLSWAYNPDIPKRDYDPDRAVELLEEAGWMLGDGEVREKDGEPLTFEILNIAGEQERVQILSFIQAQWREIGVNAEIANVDVGAMWGNALPNRDYDMAYSYTGRTADPDMSTHYLSPELGSGNNFAGYSNPDVDELLLSALETIDEEERRQLYFEAQEIVAEDEVYLFLNWLANHTAINTRVQGYRPAPGYNEFWNIEEWSVSED